TALIDHRSRNSRLPPRDRHSCRELLQSRNRDSQSQQKLPGGLIQTKRGEPGGGARDALPGSRRPPRLIAVREYRAVTEAGPDHRQRGTPRFASLETRDVVSCRSLRRPEPAAALDHERGARNPTPGESTPSRKIRKQVSACFAVQT